MANRNVFEDERTEAQFNQAMVYRLECQSLFRHAMLVGYKNEGMDDKTASVTYKAFADETAIGHSSADEFKELTVNRLLDSRQTPVLWHEVLDSYMRDTRNPSVAADVAREVLSETESRAYEMAMNGGWSTITDAYLTDEQRIEVKDVEDARMDSAEDMYGAGKVFIDKYFEVAEKQIAQEKAAKPVENLPYEIVVSKKGVPYVNADVELDGNTQHVHFVQNYSGHTFENDEIQTLLRGESLDLQMRSGNVGTVKLGETKYMGRTYFGLQRVDKERMRETPDVSSYDKGKGTTEQKSIG